MTTKVLILAYYKPSLRTIIETNSFDYMSSKVLFQFGEDRLLHLIAFFSKNLNLVECNYEIDDKELFTIIRYFE